jgi:DNA-binding response OmpR family regulator
MLPEREDIASLVVCDDDEVTLDMLCDHLAADRFGVMPAPSASDALRLCRYNHPDLLLLDLSLPDASGLDVLREIREADGGRSGDHDRVRGLDSGADDYIVKPFRYGELRARINAVLRRRAHANEGPTRVGELTIDPGRRRVMVGERFVSLSKKEFGLLRILASDPTRVFTKEELLMAVWAYRGPSKTRTLDSHASRLRRKLDPEHGRFVINCWGIGYRLIEG